jgi:hypothetical protein
MGEIGEQKIDETVTHILSRSEVHREIKKTVRPGKACIVQNS